VVLVCDYPLNLDARGVVVPTPDARLLLTQFFQLPFVVKEKHSV